VVQLIFPRTIPSPPKEALRGLRTLFLWALVSFLGFHVNDIATEQEPTECTGVIWAFLLSPTQRVRRRDGSKIAMSSSISWKQEFSALLKHMKRRKVSIFVKEIAPVSD
jgi:hypothetical protein